MTLRWRSPKRKKRPRRMTRPLPKMPAPATRRRAMPQRGRRLFDLGFLELDVLAHDGVVFAEGHLLGDVPRILLRHIIEAGVGGADELDLDGGRLGHDSLFCKCRWAKNKSGVPAAPVRRRLCPAAVILSSLEPSRAGRAALTNR